MQRKPVALLLPVGSASLSKALKDRVLEKYDVVVVNAVPGSDVLRDPGHPGLFHVRAGDCQQIEKIIQHARTLGITSLHVLPQDIPTGVSGLATVKEAAAREGGKLKVEGVSAKLEDAALREAALGIAQSGTQSVLVIGNPKFMADARLPRAECGCGAARFQRLHAKRL